MTIFTYAAKYWITGRCISPLRTSNADGEMETVLRTADGQAFIQAASIAGAMKSWLKEQTEITKIAALFGGQEKEGHLIFSDAMFEKETEIQFRPRLRINGKSGTAADGGKFDVAQICTDAKFDFCITWMAEKENPDEIAMVENMLAALHQEQIRLGGQKTNGFGRVTLSVKKQCFDMKKETDRETWLENKCGGAELKLPKISARKEVRFIVYGQADSILVKAAAVQNENGKSWTGNITENGKPVLPASSVKGAVRSRAETIAKYLRMEGLATSVFGEKGERGNEGLPGKVMFRDVALQEKTRKITRIRIDKFTGGVIRQGLFTEEPLCTPVQFEIVMQEELGDWMDAACGLMLFALKDLGQGLYHLGSGWAIGRGEVKIEKIEMQAQNTKAVLNFEKDGSCTLQDETKMVHGWLKSLEVMQHEN